MSGEDAVEGPRAFTKRPPTPSDRHWKRCRVRLNRQSARLAGVTRTRGISRTVAVR